MLSELNHRVKNTLATVQSIASQTLRKSENPADFVASFLGRLQSLATAHTLLTQSNWQGAVLGALIRTQVMTNSADDDRISCFPVPKTFYRRNSRSISPWCCTNSVRTHVSMEPCPPLMAAWQ